MRKLLYIFLLGFCLSGCHDNRFYLDKVEALWSVDADSMRYYLLKVDSASLAPDERLDYDYYRLGASYRNLLSQEKTELDSTIRMLEAHYPKGHERAFNVRLIRWTYCFHRLKDTEMSDILLDEMKGYIRNHADSVFWYRCKYQQKALMQETDSAFHYLREAEKYRLSEDGYIYMQMGNLYLEGHQPDSALACYQKALEQDSTTNMFHLENQMLDLLVKRKNSQKAWEVLAKMRTRMNRSDVPYYNLVKGDLWMELHQPDSAMKHWRIATETGNDFVASQALERMGDRAIFQHSEREAFDYYLKSQRVWKDIYLSVDYQRQTLDFEGLELKHQLAQMKVERQKHTILILGLALAIVVLTSGFVIYIYRRKRMNERNCLMQENLMLKQQEELGALREKDARMREELFKRMNVFEKLSDTEKEKHIRLSDTDWKEIRLMLDSGYNDFTRKLLMNYPDLSEKEVNFCCLVKINMSLQSLSDIYCISKNSVSRRKLRLKEKMGIGEEETLDEFLGRFF